MDEDDKVRQAWVEYSIGLHEQTAKNSQDNAKTKDGKPADLPAAVTRITETLDAGVHRSDSDNEKRPAKDLYQFGIVALTAILAGTAIITNLQTCRALKDSRDSFHAAQRAVVTFGSKTGKLAEFGPPPPSPGKRLVVAYFYNAGQSTARHVTIHLTSNANSPQAFRHRHRAKDEFITSVSGSGSEFDLAAQAEHSEYLTDPALLIMDTVLADPKRIFSIFGEVEYCDIFGVYHCEPFSARWAPAPISDFVAEPTYFRCIVEDPDPHFLQYMAFGQTRTLKEIEPCEQPNEPEYARAPKPDVPMWGTLAPTPRK